MHERILKYTLNIKVSVHVLHFSVVATPCPLFKSQKYTLPFLKVNIAPCPFLEVKNALCPFSEMKNKPCSSLTISRARKPMPTENRKMLLEKYASEKIPLLKNSRFCTKTPFCF